MTPAEIEEQYRHMFGLVRQNADPKVWWIVDSLQRSMELTMAATEGQRLNATLAQGMLGTRLAVVERNDD